MKSLEDQMSFYSAYHLDARNRATHFIGVPLIMLSLFIPFGWIRIETGPVTLDGALIFAAIVIAWYFLLDAMLAVAMIAVAGGLLALAAPLSSLPISSSALWFTVLFVLGWVIQLVGHVFEGRRPALADNFLQIFVAPIFLCAEVFFALGWRPQLRYAVNRRAVAMRSAAQPSSAAAGA